MRKNSVCDDDDDVLIHGVWVKQLKQLEEIRGDHHSPKSSYASTTSSGTLTSDGQPSLTDLSPERLRLEKRCRPVNEVMMEVEEKGSLMDRLLHAEDRILKVTSY